MVVCISLSFLFLMRKRLTEEMMQGKYLKSQRRWTGLLPPRTLSPAVQAGPGLLGPPAKAPRLLEARDSPRATAPDKTKNQRSIIGTLKTVSVI